MYYATIMWEPCIEDGEILFDGGEYTIIREKFSWLLEGTKEYLKDWEGRKAYLETAAYETETESVDITDKLKKHLYDYISFHDTGDESDHKSRSK